MSGADLLDDADRLWAQARWDSVAAPHGVAALANTVWLDASEQEVPSVAGKWKAVGPSVVGVALAGSGYIRPSGEVVGESVILATGDELVAGDRRLRAFVRGGSPALRVLDPDSAGRVGLIGIDSYPRDPSWRVRAHFEPNDEPVTFELVDGYNSVVPRTGVLTFRQSSREVALTASVTAKGLSIVFSDATSGVVTYRFRFLHADLPDAEGWTTLDFNRSFLPPCAFSPHYVCPLPPPGNRLDFPVAVGEKLPKLRG